MRVSFLVKILIGGLSVAVARLQSENPRVATSLGEIQGSCLATRLNRTIYAFRGIRYAQAPIGKLRFKPPLPVEKWSGIYNATVDGPMCPQPGKDFISEDCLVLNVYTTKLPEDASSHPKRPVIVYIHAGGFYTVSGHSQWAGPQYFLDRDIVLVTINYRLGSLGFLSTGRDAPGNYGLKDQVLAFKWIRDHIEAFGGDSNSVTLFGYSAGAVSISLHLVSPMSRGLFHKAIISSGSAFGQFRLPKNQLDLAKKQARLVGCPDDVGPKRILRCLRTVSAKSLGDSLPGFFDFAYNPILVWYPVIEEDYGQERFLSEDPLQMIERGDFAQIPIVTGVTKDEFAGKAFPIVANQTVLDLLNANFDAYAPIWFLYERGTPKSRRFSSDLRRFYLGEEPITNGSFSGLAKVYADSIIGFPVNRFVNLISEKSSQKVFYYEFAYQGRFSHVYIPGSNDTIPYGVVHHDDLIYLFYVSALFPFFDENYPEGEMVETLTLLWATFAQTGKPISGTDQKFKGIEWEPYDISRKKYMEIGKTLCLKEGLYQDRYDFWNRHFPVTL